MAATSVGGTISYLAEQEQAMLSKEMTTEQIKEEEERVADIKKCLQFALHTQVMRKNIQRSAEMVDAFKERAMASKVYF